MINITSDKNIYNTESYTNKWVLIMCNESNNKNNNKNNNKKDNKKEQ